MPPTYASRRFFAVFAAALLAISTGVVPASAASTAATSTPFNDDLAELLKTTAASQRIPVIVEGAPDWYDAVTRHSRGRAGRAGRQVALAGGHVRDGSGLLGAVFADLTPA